MLTAGTIVGLIVIVIVLLLTVAGVAQVALLVSVQAIISLLLKGKEPLFQEVNII